MNELPTNAKEFIQTQATPGRFQIFDADSGAIGEVACDRFGNLRLIQLRKLDHVGRVESDELLSEAELRELFNESGRKLQTK